MAKPPEDENEALERIKALAKNVLEESDTSYAKSRTEERIDHIVGMMCSGTWVTGKSHRALAQLWGIGAATISDYSFEANRVIRRWVRDSPMQKEEHLSRLVQSFERLAQKSEARGSTKGYRDAIDCYKMLATLHGVMKPASDANAKDSDFDGWTYEEKKVFAETGKPPERKLTSGREEKTGSN